MFTQRKLNQIRIFPIYRCRYLFVYCRTMFMWTNNEYNVERFWSNVIEKKDKIRWCENKRSHGINQLKFPFLCSYFFKEQSFLHGTSLFFFSSDRNFNVGQPYERVNSGISSTEWIFWSDQSLQTNFARSIWLPKLCFHFFFTSFTRIDFTKLRQRRWYTRQIPPSMKI